MSRYSYPLLALSISALALLACTATMAQADYSSVPVSVTVGQTFSLSVKSNPTTGYQWQLARPLDQRVVRFVSKNYVPPESKLASAGGTDIWTFQAIGKGSVEIPLIYVRPWVKNKPPAESATFRVNVSQ
ncbi:MAG: protease inhibitor I42 family protein [Alphaproteobacteria bacterium]|nr:protease inhibitor I42 family protein [Alphaproteobacteria bacterium]